MIYGKVTIDTSGFQALASPARLRAVTKKGVTAGARLIRDDAKARAPKVSRALAAAIGVKAEKGRRGKTLSYALVGARKKVVKMVTRPGRKTPVKAVPAFYLHMVEGGTRPHGVTKGDRIARKGKATAAVGQKGRMHPGAHPMPFLESAFASRKDAAGQKAMEVMGAEVQKEIAKAAAKLAGVK
jgi:hypothetical protein